MKTFFATLIALIALSLPTLTHAEESAPTQPQAGAGRIISGDVVLDRNCDGSLHGDRRVRTTAKIAVQIIDLSSGDVIATVDVVKGQWVATVPLQGEYGVTIPRWLGQMGYSPSPVGDSILVGGDFTSRPIESTTAAAGPIGLCRIR